VTDRKHDSWSMESRWLVFEVVLALELSMIMSLVYLDGSTPSRDLDTWRYLHASIFQGLAALISVSVLVAFFYYERVESRLDRLRQSCLDAVGELSSTFPNYLDELKLLDLLKGRRAIMKKYEEVVSHAKAHEEKGGEGGPSEDEVKKAKEEWKSWHQHYSSTWALYKSLKTEELTRRSIGRLVRYYVVPTFMPVVWSIVALTFTDTLTDTNLSYTFWLFAALLLTLLFTLRFVNALGSSIWKLLKEEEPSQFEEEAIAEWISSLRIPSDVVLMMVKRDQKE